MWMTNETAYMVRLADVNVAPGGRFVVSLAPDSMYTVTTTTGQHEHTRGIPAPPEPRMFQMPYDDSFETTQLEQGGKYFADQCGSWQVLRTPAGSGTEHALTQVVVQRPGANKWDVNSPYPNTGEVYQDRQLMFSLICTSPRISLFLSHQARAFVYR